MTFPALYVPAIHHFFSLGNSPALVGRAKDALLQLDDPSISREQFTAWAENEAVWLEPRSTTVPTYVDGVAAEGAVELHHGQTIRIGATSVILLKHAESRFNMPAGHDGYSTVFAGRDNDSASTTVHDAFSGEYQLEAATVIGRDSTVCGLRLDHPLVSRRHAEIRMLHAETTIRDLGSSNGTYLNGQHLAGWRTLATGDSIDIGPYSFQFTGRGLVTSSRESNLRLTAMGLTRSVRSRKSGQMVTILKDVSLVIEPNEFVCLLGRSGSGKSTLMDALSARVPADPGSVFLNEKSLYENFSLLKQGIAFVPQQNILHEELTVLQSLTYTAKLRLAPDTPEQEYACAVESALEKVDLAEHAATTIRNLSGGQKRRVVLASEILSRPNILFLDEVTSGLDEGIDWEMMSLFRKMADSGMTVVCVTHTMANVEEFCHKVVIMADPGVLAFYGTPSEAKGYFEVEKLGDIYRKIARQPEADWARAYRDSNYFGVHIARLLPREVSRNSIPVPVATWRSQSPEILRQLGILTIRQAKLLLADRRSLAIAAAQSVVIALSVALVFGAGIENEPGPKQQALMFFLGISCFWFGCNNVSKEIVKESALYQRERDVNLTVPGYVLSKLIVFGSASIVQVIMLYLITRNTIGIPGNADRQLLAMIVSALTGTGLGLAVSAGARTPDQANTLVPIALIPQILLSGMMVPEMPAAAEWIATTAISSWWTLDSMTAAITGQTAKYGKGLLICAIHLLVALFVSCRLLERRDRRVPAFARVTQPTTLPVSGLQSNRI